jgi:hypothetical protein
MRLVLHLCFDRRGIDKEVFLQHTKGVIGCLLTRTWLASRDHALHDQALGMQQQQVWLPNSLQPDRRETVIG